MNIVETAAGNPAFSTLVAAVTAADLAGVLSGPGPLTVFAPTNDAFAKLPAGTVEELVKPENKAKLTAILQMHVVAGAHHAAGFMGKAVDVATLGGAMVHVKEAGGSVHVGSAKVSTADIACDNGVIHVIDTVLLPA